jgi:probable rRNA maturation factor
MSDMTKSIAENPVIIQNATDAADLPDETDFARWVNLPLKAHQCCGEVLIRLVDETESAELNDTYRHKNGPTNILSFPFDAPVEIESDLLGDLVICVPVVQREAMQQGKPIRHHWAHIVIHGVLHLLGYDHIDDSDAQKMETLEINLLKTLNIPNPYHEDLIND